MIKSSEIKQIARNKLSGNWLKAFAIAAIFMGINIAISYCSLLVQNIIPQAPILYNSVKIVFSVMLLPVSFGFISTMTKLLNGKQPSYTTIINDGINYASKSVGIFFITIFKILLPSIIISFAAVGSLFLITRLIPLNPDSVGGYLLLLFILYLIAIIVIAIITLPYVLATYALANETSLSSKEAVDRSVNLMEGNKWNFIKLMFSFLGWFILLAIIVGTISYFVPEIFKSLIEACRNNCNTTLFNCINISILRRIK